MKFNKKVIIYGLLGFVACYLYFHDYLVKIRTNAQVEEVYKREDELIRMPSKHNGADTSMHINMPGHTFVDVNRNYAELLIEPYFDLIQKPLTKIQKKQIEELKLQFTLIFDDTGGISLKKALFFSFYLLPEDSEFKVSHSNAIFEFDEYSYLVLTNDIPFALDMRPFNKLITYAVQKIGLDNIVP